MKPFAIWAAMFVGSLFLVPAVLAQSPDTANQGAASPAPSGAAAEVPRLIQFSGTLLDAQDQPMAGPLGVTFALYAQQTGGAALWMETQNAKPDGRGVYTVLLGANSANGLPAELFALSEARWLGVQVERQAEQPRVLLVSVPYALKAGDAQTLGGMPASAFVTTGMVASAGNSTGVSAAAPSSSTASTALPISNAPGAPKKAALAPAVACTSVTSDGAATVNSIAKFTTACNLESSAITETGGNVGIGTTTPAVALDVFGSQAGLRLTGNGTRQVAVTFASPTTSGHVGQDYNGVFLASDTAGKSVQFWTNNGKLNEWMRITSAGNVGIGTTTPVAKLDIAGNLNLPTTTSAAMGVLTMGGLPFLHNFGTNDTFVGTLAGNTTMTGSGNNTAVGFTALLSDTTGIDNSAFGASALSANTTGTVNSAFGFSALKANTVGIANSAFGTEALFSNTGGSSNSAFGNSALNNNSGSSNSAFGTDALFSNSIGSRNAAFGTNALLLNTSGDTNSAFGYSALGSNTSGRLNSAFGATALLNNTTGVNDAAFGYSALFGNTIGSDNAAFGYSALFGNTIGSDNAAFGSDALLANTTGTYNAAFGTSALQANTTGSQNAAFGGTALGILTTGSSNIAIGYGAGGGLTTGSNNISIGGSAAFNPNESNTIRIGLGTIVTGSNNIYIGNAGGGVEANTIRIGSIQTATFITGIDTATSASGTAVFVNSNGQLGTTTSSRRFKHEIADMGAESDLLMKLRPVAFYYKPELDETQTRQYGLVAEDVAQVAPQLVVFDKDGAPQTVRYHFVNAMLLNEVQKQRQLVEEQQRANEQQRSMIEKQQGMIAQQQAEIQNLTARLAKLEALVVPAP